MKAIATSSTPPPCLPCDGTGSLFAKVPTLARNCKDCAGDGVARCAVCGRKAVFADEYGDAGCERCGERYGVEVARA